MPKKNSRVNGILALWQAEYDGRNELENSSLIPTNFRVRDSRQCNRKYVDALWQWRRVKTSTDSVGQSLQKEFLIDDTGSISSNWSPGGARERFLKINKAITTAYISRKLDQLERLVRRGSQETFQMEREREIRQKWIRAGRFALNSISKRHNSLTKQQNIFTISENPTSPNLECNKTNNEYGKD